MSVVIVGGMVIARSHSSSLAALRGILEPHAAAAEA